MTNIREEVSQDITNQTENVKISTSNKESNSQTL